MPAYEYVCSNCEAKEQRIGGLDDHTIICDQCGQVMVRQAIWTPYWLPILRFSKRPTA